MTRAAGGKSVTRHVRNHKRRDLTGLLARIGRVGSAGESSSAQMAPLGSRSAAAKQPSCPVTRSQRISAAIVEGVVSLWRSVVVGQSAHRSAYVAGRQRTTPCVSMRVGCVCAIRVLTFGVLGVGTSAVRLAYEACRVIVESRSNSRGPRPGLGLGWLWGRDQWHAGRDGDQGDGEDATVMDLTARRRAG